MNEHLRDEEAIFHIARRLPPDQRVVYLKQVCGTDRALQVRVESLLAAHEEAGFLEVPAVDATSTIDQPVTECPGMVIGRYPGVLGFHLDQHLCPLEGNVAPPQ